jgi:hypothetical protein
MNRKYIESLTKFIEGRTSILSVADAIEIWFEQNPTIEPVVVGLSDEQLGNFYNSSCAFWDTEVDFLMAYREWAKAQTFAEPYDLESLRIATDLHDRAAEGFKKVVKEITITVGLTDEQVRSLSFHILSFNKEKSIENSIHEYLKTQTSIHYNNEGKVYELDGTVTDYKAGYERVLEDFFALETEYSKLREQPVVVGLSDEQMSDFGAFVYGFDKSALKLENMLRDWHSRQTFSQSKEYAKHTIDGLMVELKKCHEIIRAHQFQQPNWNDVPEADTVSLVVNWYKNDGMPPIKATTHCLERPKPPTLTVEVG